jgi:hypothetical protein
VGGYIKIRVKLMTTRLACPVHKIDLVRLRINIMASKCALCKKKQDNLWPRNVNGKKKMLCDDCKEYYPIR